MPGSSIVIEEYESLKRPASIHTVYILYLMNGSGSRRSVRTVVQSEMKKHFPGSYELQVQEGWFSVGASDFWEEAVLRISDAIASGGGEALVGGLIAWYVNRRKRLKQLGHDSQNNDWEGKLQWQLDSFKRQIASHFKVETDALVLVECEQQGISVTAIFRDSLGNQYEGHVTEQGYTMLKKLK